jgi:hypothetical protein
MSKGREILPGLVPYLKHLDELPFIDRVKVGHHASDGRKSTDLELKTPTGAELVEVKWSKSHLSRQLVEHLVRSSLGSAHSAFVFAPRIGGETAKRFERAGINYVDLAGNCHVRLGENYVAHIQGRRPPQQAPKERHLRQASLRVLFTLLAQSHAIEQTVRKVALLSGNVSPQTVTDVRKRLVAEGCVVEQGRRYRWTPRGRAHALDLLLANYDVLAHKLLHGRYRSRHTDMAGVEQEVERALGREKTDWWWGGGAALHRETGYYRGTKTIVYTDRRFSFGPTKLISAEDGNIVIARLPGESALPENARSEQQRIVHPLLVYLDLMSEGEERARDAATELRRTIIEEEVG